MHPRQRVKKKKKKDANRNQNTKDEIDLLYFRPCHFIFHPFISKTTF